MLKLLKYIFIFFQLLNLKTGYTQDSVVVNLKTGLKEMIDLLKNGKKEDALQWFQRNYHLLHTYDLLQDSLLVQISENKPITEQKADSLEIMNQSNLEPKMHNFIVSEIERIAFKLGENPGSMLPDDFVKDVEKYIKLFTENNGYHRFFQESINRARKYIPLFKEEFTKKGFPEEILYFVIIESGFDPNAISKAGAAGMFQFMESTARQYGLEVNSNKDERFSAIRSAAAAADYMKDLYLELGSMNLALASYNSGSGKTRQALKELENLKERSFWSIRQKSAVLKNETREYVPQIFAAIILGQPKNTSKFNFIDKQIPEGIQYAVFYLPGKINLNSLIFECNIEVTELLQLNPDIVSVDSYSEMNIVDYPLYIPVNSELCIKDFLNKNLGPGNYQKINERNKSTVLVPIKKKAPKNNKSKPKPTFNPDFVTTQTEIDKGQFFEYKVAWANTINEVARFFDTEADSIMFWNQLRFKSLKRDQQLKIKATRPYIIYEYEVPENITFNQLANEFNVDYLQLKRTNSLRGEDVPKGHIILVYLKK
ncbi:MAG: transglycosylase SLT domain-containing protein [Calditrichae bacterium]|nr:transglycosylase SLT domain-containing protein [Calditrichia bacterium]